MIIVVVAVTIYALGYEYDKANELYLESVFFASDASISTYGRRWSRLSQIILLITLLFDIILIFLWFRKRQTEKEKFSLLKTD